MMDERREEARDFIRYYIWSGYYNRDEVFNIVDDEVFESDGEDETWLRESINREFRKKQEAERGWPAVTNCDRLDQVFETLRGQGILAQHRCGMTIQDGLDVIDSIYAEEGRQQAGFVGYCFYHLQDMEGAMSDDGGMLLAFGSFPPSRERAVEVGRLVRKEFERARFTVEWDDTADTRLLLKGFRWQRRGPGAD